MKSVKLFTVILLPSLFIILNLESCVNLAKRYKSSKGFRWIENDQARNYVDVKFNTFNITIPKKAETIPPTFFSLSPQGQAEYIKAVNSHSGSTDDLQKNIVKSLTTPKEENPNIKIISPYITKSMVFTVQRKWYADANDNSNISPDFTLFNEVGDRISFLELDMQMTPKNNTTFNSWDKYVTDFETVNLGQVSSAQNWSATASASAQTNVQNSSSNSLAQNTTSSIGNTIANTLSNDNTQGFTSPDQTFTYGNTNSSSNGSTNTTGSGTNNTNTSGTGKTLSSQFGPSANLNFADKYQTDLTLTNRRVKLSGYLNNDRMILRQEGATGIDLSGNTVLSVEYFYDGAFALPITLFSFSNYFTAKIPNDLSVLKLDKTLCFFPDITSDITCDLRFKYIYRAVLRGNKHLPESRQRVEFKYGSVGYNPSETDVRYLSKPENVVLIKKEDLRPTTYEITAAGKFLLYSGATIDFTTAVDAATFLDWLTKATQAGKNTNNLTIDGKNITTANIASLTIFIKKN